MKFKNILVIGGAGFIGANFVNLLLKSNLKSKVIVFDNLSRGKISNIENSKNIKLIHQNADVRNIDYLEKVVKDENVDCIFNFSALWLLHCEEFTDSAFEINVKGNFNILKLIEKYKIKKYVFSSSASVYGDAIYEPMDENHPFNNTNFYGSTKISCEEMIKAFSIKNNFQAICLRYMNVYGEGQDDKGAYVPVIVNMIRNAKDNKPIQIHGNGKQSYDFVNVKDCALANLKALNYKLNGFYTFNVGTGVKTSLIDLAKQIKSIFNSKSKIIFKKTTRVFVTNRVGCTKKSKRLLKFNSEVDLKSGLKNLSLHIND